MKYIAAAYIIFTATVGVSNTDAGMFTRFAYVAMPCAMAQVCSVATGNAIIHWHL